MFRPIPENVQTKLTFNLRQALSFNLMRPAPRGVINMSGGEERLRGKIGEASNIWFCHYPLDKFSLPGGGLVAIEMTESLS